MVKRWKTALALPVFAAGLSPVLHAQAQIGVDTARSRNLEKPTTDSNYAAEVPFSSGYNLELLSGVTFDDNALESNANQQDDWVFQESAVFDLWKERPLWDIAFRYKPTVLLFKSQSSVNTLDHDLTFNASYRFTHRLRLGLDEAFNRNTGFFQASSNQNFSLPTTPPPGLNGTLLTPLSTNLSNSVYGDLQYAVSKRGSLDFTGGYAFVHYSGVDGVSAPPLLNTESPTAGASYEYRFSKRLTGGVRYLYELFHYGAGISDRVHSGFLTALWEVGPHAVVSLYGGPQYSQAGGATPPRSIFSTFSSTTLTPGGGGSFTLRSDETVLQISAQRVITNGGGVLETVTNSYEGLQARRLLQHGWDVIILATNAQSTSLHGGFGPGKVNTQTIGAAVEHPVSESLGLHFEYDYQRQRVNQFVPFGTNLDRNTYTVSVFYRLGEHPL